ncbi:hypothetical protein LZ32DRAFT_298971 [Colletotrichum eremochloae]|nr:hypothetical protein LZ32DRAFT_298971 [Colletotrichum eremochloae]
MGDASQRVDVSTQGWSPKLTEAIVKVEGNCTPRWLCIHPVGFRCPHRRGPKIVADVMHLMTTFVGEDVKDAMRLVGAIISAAHGGNGIDVLHQKVKAFEIEMFLCMERVWRLTEELMHDFVSMSDAPGTTISGPDHEAGQVRDPVGIVSTGSWHGAFFSSFLCASRGRAA